MIWYSVILEFDMTNGRIDEATRRVFFRAKDVRIHCEHVCVLGYGLEREKERELLVVLRVPVSSTVRRAYICLLYIPAD